MTPDQPLRLGVSTCLLGERVRYDGGHKRDRWLTDVLAPFVEYVPVCPEHECGLGVPRESMHLAGSLDSPRLVTTKTKRDLTDQMLAWCSKRVVELEKEGLCGFVFKASSPSSGMARVRVYSEKGQPEKKGVGLFARAFMDHFPLLPVEEEGRLKDARLRESFIERIFAYRRWQLFLQGRPTRGGLVDLHTREKLLILSHHPTTYKELGRLVAGVKGRKLQDVLTEYEALFAKALSYRATIAKHMNVLQHLLGYFKKLLTPDEKQELLETFEAYRAQLVPLIVPLTLVKHYVRKYEEPYLSRQTYLSPHPAELMLRNHV